jgi:hypothetical protein
LRQLLVANATDAESRLAGKEALAAAKLFIGNAAGVATAQTLSGAITVNTNGVTAITAGTIVNADVNNSAAIAYSKLANGSARSVLGVVGDAAGANASIAAGTDHHVLRRSGDLGFGLLIDANIDAAAAIAYSKLALAGSILDADIAATAAIAHTKLAPVAPAYLLVGNASSQAVAVAVSGDVTMNNAGEFAIASGVIVNADVNANAAIASSKLAADVVRSGDATAAQLIQSGVIPSDDQTAKVVVFNTAYADGTSPVVVCTYAGDPGAVQPFYVSSVASNSFTLTVTTTNQPINWMAIGQK